MPQTRRPAPALPARRFVLQGTGGFEQGTQRLAVRLGVQLQGVCDGEVHLQAPAVLVVHLFADGPHRVQARMQARSGHYMPVSLLDSQFAALEPPRGESDVFALDIDVAPARMLEQALAILD